VSEYARPWKLAALAAMRAANFPASPSLYGFCAIGWLYSGSLAELRFDVRQALIKRERR
jgi:hypothetical protein